MTGLELLKEELLKKGHSKTKLDRDTKLIRDIVTILAKDEEQHIALNFIEVTREKQKEKEQSLKAREIDLSNRACKLINREMEFREIKRDAEIEVRNATVRLEELKREIEELENKKVKLSDCKSEFEYRLILFEAFKESIEVRSVYDNTAFIYAAGAILGGESLPEFTPDHSDKYGKTINVLLPRKKKETGLFSDRENRIMM